LTARLQTANHRCQGSTIVRDVLEYVEANDRVDALCQRFVRQVLDTTTKDIDVVEIANAVLENVGQRVVRFNCADSNSARSEMQRKCANAGANLEDVRSSVRKRARKKPFVVARRVLLECPEHPRLNREL
jgi:hypothetical protein